MLNKEAGSVIPQGVSSAPGEAPVGGAKANQGVPSVRREADYPRHGGSGVSWAAILAGAAAAAALSLILLVLGTGLGFSVISPWSSSGAGAAAIGISAAVWLAATQIVASGLGGYLAGRLRVKWLVVHTDEVYFRDTAHGMLSWAIATLLTAALAGFVLAGAVSTGARVAGGVVSSVSSLGQGAAGNTVGNGGDGQFPYFVAMLFRTDKVAENPGKARAQNDEAFAQSVFLHSLKAGALDEQDKAYLARVVVQHAGLSQAEAERRVGSLYVQAQESLEQIRSKAKEAADAARKATAATALWAFIALLCGAFFASLAAIWGGRRRDMAMLDPERSSIV